MGTTYANLVCFGTSVAQVTGALGGSAAFVCDLAPSVVAVFARQDEESLGAGPTAAAVVGALGCAALDAMVFDSDVCQLRLFSTNSVPITVQLPWGVWEDFDEPEPAGLVDRSAFAVAVTEAAGRGELPAAAAALQAEPTFVEEVHARLLDALDLPRWPAGWGFRYLASDGPPLPDLHLVRTGEA